MPYRRYDHSTRWIFGWRNGSTRTWRQIQQIPCTIAMLRCNCHEYFRSHCRYFNRPMAMPDEMQHRIYLPPSLPTVALWWWPLIFVPGLLPYSIRISMDAMLAPSLPSALYTIWMICSSGSLVCFTMSTLADPHSLRYRSSVHSRALPSAFHRPSRRLPTISRKRQSCIRMIERERERQIYIHIYMDYYTIDYH